MNILKNYFNAPIIIISLLVLPLMVNSQNSITETFSSGDIPSNLNNYDPLCAAGNTLTFTLPAGENVNIDSISVSYDFQSVGFPPSAQQSSLFCQNNNTTSPVFSNVNGVPGSLESYDETGLTLANGVYAGGTNIQITMRAWRSFGSASGCNSTEQYIVNGSWSVTIFHSDPYDAPKVGVNTTTPEATLDVFGKIKIADDLIDPVEGMVKYDAANKEFSGHDGTDWKSFTSSTIIADGDEDTKINVEATADDDVIRLISQDSMGWEILRSNLKPVGTNGGIYIGEAAGENANQAERNIAIGHQALKTNVVASGNVAVGDSALYSNGIGVSNPSSNSGSYNTAIGARALTNNTIGSWSTAVGAQALNSNTTAQANTAIGFQSLYSTTTGGGNQAIGLQALFSNKTGQSNIAIGNTALYSNVSGIANIAIGLQNMYNNTASFNTSVGYQGLQDNTIGERNAAFGYGVLRNNTAGSRNTSLGMTSLAANTLGNNNTAIGNKALYNNTTGNSNVAIGIDALYANTDRSNLIAIGDSALYHNGIGSFLSEHAFYNLAIGSNTLHFNKTGYNNLAIGNAAMKFNESGVRNLAIGKSALQKNKSGRENVGIGNNSLINNLGNFNTAVGSGSLSSIISGDYNTALGSYANENYDEINNTIAIGYSTITVFDNEAHIGNASTSSIGGYAPWTTLSDARFKSNIQENVIGLNFIKKLKPVTYNLNQKAIEAFHEKHSGRKDTSFWETKYDHSKITQSGFLAQDVEAAAQALGYDFNGVDAPTNEESHYGLRYALFTVPLVKAVQELDKKEEQTNEAIQVLKEKVINKDQKIAALEVQLAVFEKRMQTLEKLIETNKSN